jgi:hypothetical protein
MQQADTSSLARSVEKNMGLRLEVKLAGIPDQQLATLQVLTTNIHAILEDLAVNLGIPSFDVTVVLASDFAGEVSAVLRSVEGDNGEVFTTERIGGAVTGKCIPLADDYSDHVIVLDRTVCQVGDPNGQAWFIVQLAHELIHVVFGRARHASGALEDVPRWPRNVVDRARSIARIVTEEYRVDLISSKILERFGTVTDQQGTTRPLTAYDLVGDGHRDELERTLDATVHPGWPDTVQGYRERQLSLEELWRQMSLTTESVLTLVAHTEGHAAIGDRRSPLDELGQHRGVQLYLAPVWQALLDVLNDERLLPGMDATRADQKRITDIGGQAILEMWRRLGLEVEVDPHNGRSALWVSKPQR